MGCSIPPFHCHPDCFIRAYFIAIASLVLIAFYKMAIAGEPHSVQVIVCNSMRCWLPVIASLRVYAISGRGHLASAAVLLLLLPLIASVIVSYAYTSLEHITDIIQFEGARLSTIAVPPPSGCVLGFKISYTLQMSEMIDISCISMD